MIILDTNVLSALMLERPDQAVVAWLDEQRASAVATTVLTVFEIMAGIERLPAGRRRSFLELSFRTTLNEALGRRVIALDESGAEAAGRVDASLRRLNRTIGSTDTLIAGIALSAGATLATRNIRHFEGLGLPLIDPWSASP